MMSGRCKIFNTAIIWAPLPSTVEQSNGRALLVTVKKSNQWQRHKSINIIMVLDKQKNGVF